MTEVYKKFGTVNVIQDTSVNNYTYINKGIIMSGPAVLKNRQSEDLNVAVGSVYSKGNISRSLINLSNIGTLIGNKTLEDDSEAQQISYNYLTSLIPGIYPSVGGPWSEDQQYYDLSKINDYVQNPNRYFCKILGFGLGDIESFQVSEVNKNGLSMNSNNFFTQKSDGFIDNPISLKQINWSCIAQGYTENLTSTGENFYMRSFDWQTQYGLELINGTNLFPFFGWSGARIGSIKPETFQFQQNSLYNYPSSFLQLAKEYESLGLVYAGQGVQYSSFINRKTKNEILIKDRNVRSYQTKINNRFEDQRITSIIPYQQGRGVYEFYSNEVTYNQENGLIDNTEPQTIVGAEGVQPGRNNAFAGFAITDYWSPDINFNNIEAGSTTSIDTRFSINKINQTKTAHNAPLCYTSNLENNTNNPLPWNSLFGYIGTTTSSASNKRSDNTPILKQGVTTAVISGAYPLYRGCWNTESNSNKVDPITSSFGLDQYYYTEEFWDPTFKDPATPQIQDINGQPPIPPNPPYRIKGGRIVLFEGQRVKAGSYVYASMNMCGNVNMSQFYGPAAKDIVLNEGERDQLLGDVYSKYQSNQGGMIVMVSIDGKPPPMPPSCAQPVGIILEEIVGFGKPKEIDGKPLYEPQSDVSTSVQLTYDRDKVNQLQSREIMIEFFPMYPNMYINGVNPTFFNFIFFSIPLPFTTSGTSISSTLNDGQGGALGSRIINPLLIPFRSTYTSASCPNSWIVGFTLLSEFKSPYNFFDFKSKQFLNDWPGPQSPSFGVNI